MTFNWLISQLDSIPSLDGMDKVIKTIHWRAQKNHEYIVSALNTEEEAIVNTFTVDTYGALAVDAPHEASFTPYD